MSLEFYQTNTVTTISEKEAAEICGVSVQSVAYHRRKGHITPLREKPIVLYDLQDVMALKISLRKEIGKYYSASQPLDKTNIICPFRGLTWEKDESFRFLDLFHFPKLKGDPLKYYTSKRYAVSNKGRVVDLDMGKEVALQKVHGGYLQAPLKDPFRRKGSIHPMAHTLVGLLWCENGRYCSEFHHLNAVKDDNRAENLLPCTHQENLHADDLLREYKQNPEDENLKKAYEDYIEMIRTLNKENADEFRVVIDPDDDDTGGFHCLFIRKDAYDRLANEGTWEGIRPQDIVGEYVDITAGKESEE